jgi:ABC-type antimicrobial peptide transport system permease subunit
VSYGVARRTHEIGVRVALGAARGHVVGMIVGQAMVPVIGGLVVGLAGALGATRLLRSLLFEVTPTDPLTFAVVTAILLVAALGAAYLPARRATRIDPMAALRCE